MGCASSSPMVQTAGNDMLKAATHVAEDATKSAEEAVQGVKESMGKTLETAKETVATKVEEVKHDVETTLKDKVHDLDDAKNALLGKLNLNAGKTVETVENSAMAMKEDAADKGETAMDTLHSIEETMTSSSQAMEEAKEMVGLVRTNTETDSLRTSTPEPEIERALANTKTNKEDGDDDEDNPPTPKPTLAELENLSQEVLQQQQHTVNDMLSANDHQADTKIALPTVANTSSTTESNAGSSAMHLTPLPLTSASSIATMIAASTAGAGLASLMSATPPPAASEQEVNAQPVKTKAAKRQEKLAAERVRQQKLIQKLLEEKRPGTTEWEKYADMLALFRKYNPHDAFRRGGTLTKFNGHGTAPIRENPLHGMGGGDDDSSDTTSVWGRKSPTRRSSARLAGRLRPTSASQRTVMGNTARRSSNSISSGRKFDYNPHRSRVSERGGSSSVSSGHNLSYLPTSKASAYRLSPSSGTPMPTYAQESVKSPPEMRSQHSLGTNSFQRALEPLWWQQQTHLPQLGQQQGKAGHHTPFSPSRGGSSMPFAAKSAPFSPYSALTRDSSANSLSSQAMYPGRVRLYKSSLDLRLPALLSPLRQPHSHHHHHHHNHHHHLVRQHPPVRNTSSFLATPRTSQPFSITKSYTDLYFSSTNNNKENETSIARDLSPFSPHRHARDKSPYRIRDRCEYCPRKYVT
ncbi:uncharacterized protein LOC106093691 [Stomoxys calcitrans]|uniref:uncharacterized protein LOC106093691 n=1 Tax=Stomoxys calcitrans TaxID=35570 RepID=UPI0027E32D9C|nr:uncharacterized protein LOC106093691 [Stomoxys calcitrans]